MGDAFWWAAICAASLTGALTAAAGVRLSLARRLSLAEKLADKQRELEQRLKERALLFEVLRESTSTHDLDHVLEGLVARVGEALRAERFAVLLRERGVDGDRATLRVRAAWGWSEDADPSGQVVRRPGGPWALERGLVLIPDVERGPAPLAAWDALPRRGSFASAPITHRGEDIGQLVLTRPEDDPLGEIAGRFLEAIADQAAIAIHNAQLIEQLEDLSTHDELTGLPNRRLFQRRLDRALAHGQRYSHPVSVLALDIDHFKQLNDRHGHPAGDAALRALAESLVRELREVDTVARAGGEEFWVLLPETDRAAAQDVAGKLLDAARGIVVEGASQQPLGHLSVSAGIASRLREEAPDALLARADQALYAAKLNGRDRAVLSP